MNPRFQFQFSGTEGSLIVRVEGLEPPWIAPPDPKSGMSTNFTTPAFCRFPFYLAFQPNSSHIKRHAVKKGVQIYRYFITKSAFFQKSGELVKAFLRSIRKMIISLED